MTIPKSYEALAADLASEKIISKTLQGQKESYMMLADGRKFDLYALRQRLNVSEQRAVELEGLLLEALMEGDISIFGPYLYERLASALKSSEEGDKS